MEPFKALVLLAAAAIVSFVSAGAIGFYAGYSAGRGNLDEIKAHIASVQTLIPSPDGGGAVSLKPVLDDVRAVSKQVEALAAVKASAAADQDSNTKLVLDEIRGLANQIDGFKQDAARAGPAAPLVSAPVVSDQPDSLREVRDQLAALSAKLDKQEPKAPKAIIDEIRSLGGAMQGQEQTTRRAVAEEVRAALASEPKTPKAILDEIRGLTAAMKAPEARSQTPQASLVDQIKVLQASVDTLKAKLGEEQSRAGAMASAEIVQIRQLLAAASDQFGKCQTQLASISALAAGVPSQTAATPAAITVSQDKKSEPSAIVFYDNVMLKKDQEKQYDEIGVKLSLQTIGPRQVKVAVNRQGFGLGFGERKVFRSQDVECEINLMETNLNESQARLSISCKR